MVAKLRGGNKQKETSKEINEIPSKTSSMGALNSRTKTVLLYAMLSVAPSLVSKLQAQNLYVNPSIGVDVGNCQDPLNPCKTLIYGAAIAPAGATTTIECFPGNYTQDYGGVSIATISNALTVKFIATASDSVFILDDPVRVVNSNITIQGVTNASGHRPHIRHVDPSQDDAFLDLETQNSSYAPHTYSPVRIAGSMLIENFGGGVMSYDFLGSPGGARGARVFISGVESRNNGGVSGRIVSADNNSTELTVSNSKFYNDASHPIRDAIRLDGNEDPNAFRNRGSFSNLQFGSPTEPMHFVGGDTTSFVNIRNTTPNKSSAALSQSSVIGSTFYPITKPSGVHKDISFSNKGGFDLNVGSNTHYTDSSDPSKRYILANVPQDGSNHANINMAGSVTLIEDGTQWNYFTEICGTCFPGPYRNELPINEWALHYTNAQIIALGVALSQSPFPDFALYVTGDHVIVQIQGEFEGGRIEYSTDGLDWDMSSDGRISRADLELTHGLYVRLTKDNPNDPNTQIYSQIKHINVSDSPTIDVRYDPNNQQLSLRSNSNQAGDILIYSMKGEKLLQGKYDLRDGQSDTINVNNLTAGVYMIAIQSSEGVMIKKILIQ